MTNQDLKYVTANDFTLPKISNQTVDNKLSQSLPNANTFTKKAVETKTFMKDTKMIKTYDMKLQKADIGPN